MIFPHSVYALVLQEGRVHTLQCFVSDPKQPTSDCHFVISSFHHLGWEAEGSRGGGGLYPSLVVLHAVGLNMCGHVVGGMVVASSVAF